MELHDTLVLKDEKGAFRLVLDMGEKLVIQKCNPFARPSSVERWGAEQVVEASQVVLYVPKRRTA